jgi:hypothetical protein
MCNGILFSIIQTTMDATAHYTFLPTRLLIMMNMKHTTHLYYNHLPEDEPSGLKHVEDIKNKK